MARRTAVAVLAAAFSLAGCSAPDTGSSTVTGALTVFAAASLTESFTELGDDFEAANPGVRVAFNFAGSSALARQIDSGAPADVFASASTATMEQVGEAGGLTGAATTFARNELEIVVPKGNPAKVTGLTDLGRADLKIALCAEQVPCGAAAKQVFGTAGVTAAPDTLEQDVKAALTKVKLGEVDAALVYRTDVKAAGSEVEGIEFAEAAEAVNDYPIAALAKAPNAVAAKAFVDFVLSDAGRSVLSGAGFAAP
jgi:molybdate transport system substrate-binding protein